METILHKGDTSFLRRKINKPSGRDDLLFKAEYDQKQHITVAHLPPCLFDKDHGGDGKGTFAWGNYPADFKPRRDHEPKMRPVAYGLTALSRKISGEGPNRLLALAREKALHGLPPWIKALGHAIISLGKNELNEYVMSQKDGMRMARHLQSGGVVWLAPAASTEKDGMITRINTLTIAQALERGYHLVVVGMITDKHDGARTVTEIKAEEIALPTVNYPKDADAETKKNLSRFACLAIGYYAMLRLAGLLPETQRGDYSNNSLIEMEIESKLNYLREKGVTISGGFIDQIDTQPS